MWRHIGEALFTFLVAAALAFLVLLLADLAAENIARGAPAPRKPQRPSIVGYWSMTWNGTSAPTEFRKNGTYWCWWKGRDWIGTWKLCDGKLTVRETPDIWSNEPEWYVWTVTLDSGAKWRSVKGTRPAFLLAPHRGRFD